MPSQGPKNGTSFASDSGNGGTKSWSNPGNAQFSDNLYATASWTTADPPEGSPIPERARTHWLKATGFGFTIPSGSTINGIVVEIEKRRDDGLVTVYSEDVRVVKGGVVAGTQHGNAGSWGTSDAYTTYGSSTDLWGLTWTPADINASNFGVVLAIDAESTGAFPGTYYALVDNIRITVYFTEPLSGLVMQSQVI